MEEKAESKGSEAQKDLEPSKKSAQSVKGGVDLKNLMKKVRQHLPGPQTPPPPPE